MLKTNEILDQIQQCVSRKGFDFAIQSIDANSDGTKAVLVGMYEDPDFPEMFIYDEKTGKARKINSESNFIDFPMGKAFWAENGKDVYINRYDCDTIYLIKLDTKNYKISSFVEANEKTEYIEQRLRSVTDFIYSDNNYTPPAVMDGENPYEKLLVAFAEEMNDSFYIHRRLSRASQASGAIRWENMRMLGSMIYCNLQQQAEKFGVINSITEQLDQMKKNLEPFEAVFQPAIGKCYELKWGKFLHEGKLQDWISKVRIDGEARELWIVLESNAPLDVEFHEIPVMNWCEIEGK